LFVRQRDRLKLDIQPDAAGIDAVLDLAGSGNRHRQTAGIEIGHVEDAAEARPRLAGNAAAPTAGVPENVIDGFGRLA
jgi:hypothetical protein